MGARIRFFAAIILMGICLASSIVIEAQQPPLIRLHVLANSNSPEDQALKYKVRDRIVQMMGERFKNSRSIEESREILLNSLPQAEEEARQILRQEGSACSATAYYGEFDFPTRYYGQFALPAGKYEAVRIVIGEGQGANWWCVLFPPLCFADEAFNESGRQAMTRELQDSLRQEKHITIRPAFKVVELWHETIAKVRQ